MCLKLRQISNSSFTCNDSKNDYICLVYYVASVKSRRGICFCLSPMLSIFHRFPGAATVRRGQRHKQRGSLQQIDRWVGSPTNHRHARRPEKEGALRGQQPTRRGSPRFRSRLEKRSQQPQKAACGLQKRNAASSPCLEVRQQKQI